MAFEVSNYKIQGYKIRPTLIQMRRVDF